LNRRSAGILPANFAKVIFLSLSLPRRRESIFTTTGNGYLPMQGLVYRKDLLSEWVHVKIAEDLISFGLYSHLPPGWWRSI
jgi:hypothetical protein